MPCTTYDQPPSTDSRVEHLTQLLCFTLSNIPDKVYKDLVKMDEREAPQLNKWWVEHQVKDRARKQAEEDAERERKLVAGLLNRLSPKEIDLLQRKGFRA